MDLEQKYLEDDWVDYEINGSMFMALAEFEKNQTEEILLQMDTFEGCLPVKNGQTQMVGGIVREQEGEVTLFLEISETDCDTYLDYINDKKILTQCT